MISTTVFRRGAALLLGVSALAVLPTVTNVSAAPETCAADSLCAGGEYFPLVPTRVFDNTAPADGPVEVNVLGVGGVPSQGVLAVGVNVTIANAAGNGFASVSPSDYDPAGKAPTSLINFQYAGHTVPNFGIIGVGTEGKITIDLSSTASGTSRVIVDVFGFVATSGYEGTAAVPLTDGARMVTVTPQRIYNSRPSNALGPQQSVEVPVRGQGGVPNDAAVSAVVVNLTGINNPAGNASTYLTVSPNQVPAGAADAPSSNGNYPEGVIKANLAIVPINDDGSIFVYNRNGNIHVAIDVLAYLKEGGADNTRSGRIVPLEAPFRSFDTRQAEFGSSKLGFSSWEDWSFSAFANSVLLNGTAIGDQAGLFGNLTATALEPLYPNQPVTSFLTMNPAIEGAFPESPGNSNLNVTEGGAVANASVVTYGTKAGDNNMVSAYNDNGRTHYILDVYAVILD